MKIFYDTVYISDSITKFFLKQKSELHYDRFIFQKIKPEISSERFSIYGLRKNKRGIKEGNIKIMLHSFLLYCW